MAVSDVRKANNVSQVSITETRDGADTEFDNDYAQIAVSAVWIPAAFTNNSIQVSVSDTRPVTVTFEKPIDVLMCGMVVAFPATSREKLNETAHLYVVITQLIFFLAMLCCLDVRCEHRPCIQLISTTNIPDHERGRHVFFLSRVFSEKARGVRGRLRQAPGRA